MANRNHFRKLTKARVKLPKGLRVPRVALKGGSSKVQSSFLKARSPMGSSKKK